MSSFDIPLLWVSTLKGGEGLALPGFEAVLGTGCRCQARESHALVTELTLVGKTSLFYCYSAATCSHFYSRHVIIKSRGEPLEICS